MINWEHYKIGDKLKLNFSNDIEDSIIDVSITDFEWSLHRHIILADVEVISICENTKWDIGNIIRLPIITQDKELEFLVKCPTPKQPNREIKYYGKFKLLS